MQTEMTVAVALSMAMPNDVVGSVEAACSPRAKEILFIFVSGTVLFHAAVSESLCAIREDGRIGHDAEW